MSIGDTAGDSTTKHEIVKGSCIVTPYPEFSITLQPYYRHVPLQRVPAVPGGNHLHDKSTNICFCHLKMEGESSHYRCDSEHQHMEKNSSVMTTLERRL